MLENSSSASGMVPISYLKLIDIPDYLLWNYSDGDQYDLYLSIEDFSFKENNDLNFIKGS